MPYTILIIILILLLAVLGWVWGSPKREKVILLDKRQFRQRKVVDYLKEKGTITNDQYQRLAGVSDAQATRDLDRLEKQGLIKQIGKTGKYVKYRLKT